MTFDIEDCGLVEKKELRSGEKRIYIVGVLPSRR
jgi:hypothetical protein